MADVKDIFLIYKDGRLMKHMTNEYDPTQDADILTSMFTAINHFIEESYKKGIRTIEFEDHKISVEQREHFYLAMVASPDSDVKSRLADLATGVEHKYGQLLEDWNGSRSDLKGLTSLLGKGFSENYVSVYSDWPKMS